MEKEVVITRRFQQHTLRIYQYILSEFSAKTAYAFLDHLEKRIDFIAKHPDAGKQSSKVKNVRSLLFTPHNQIFYRYSKKKIEVLCLFDMRQNPSKKPY